MNRFAIIAPHNVARPYVCHRFKNDDDEYEMIALITEWAKSDEQFANQWIDGSVDERVASSFGAKGESRQTKQKWLVKP